VVDIDPVKMRTELQQLREEYERVKLQPPVHSLGSDVLQFRLTVEDVMFLQEMRISILN
jgi:hypothetical protein